MLIKVAAACRLACKIQHVSMMSVQNTHKIHDMLIKKQTSNGSQKPEVDL
jgi:hypothetical protein